MARYRLRPAWHQWMYTGISFRAAYDAFATSIVHAYEPARRVLIAYKGPLVRLRRASDNAESDFTYIANGDLNVGAIAAWAGGASYVVTVYDQKGGDAVTQATAANQPLFTASAKSGHAGMTFDGTNDYLRGAYTIGGALSQPFSIFTLAQLDATVVNNNTVIVMVDGGDITNYAQLFQRYILTPDSWALYGGAALDDGASDANWNIWAALFNGASSQFWINGVSKISGDAGAHNPDGLTIGAAGGSISPWKGYINSVIVCDPSLSDADCVLMQTAMNAYWAAY